MADMAAISRSRTPGTRSSTPGRRRRRPGDVHELLRGDQGVHRTPRRHGVHLEQRPTALEWAFEQRRPGASSSAKVLFLPDQHLGRNTAVLELGFSLEDCVVFDPHKPDFGGLTVEQLRAARMILWRGHCSVHGRFSVDAVDDARERVPGRQRARAPGVPHEVVTEADLRWAPPRTSSRPRGGPSPARSGRSAPSSTWSSGSRRSTRTRRHFLEKNVCYCSTMNRIDLPHLVWVAGVTRGGRGSSTDPRSTTTAHWARVALDQMLALPVRPRDRGSRRRPSRWTAAQPRRPT
jgi:quinolinate synthase